MIENLTIRCVPINEIDVQEWNNFLLSISEATYFCTTDHWQSFDNADILQIRNEKKDLIAGIPFRTQSVIPIIGRFFKFCRLDSSVLVRSSFSENDLDFLKKTTFNYLIEHLRKAGVVFLYISPMTRSRDGKLLKDIGFGVDRCATLSIDLTSDVNDIFKSFSKGNKSSIHLAQKKGVIVKIFEGKSALNYVSDFSKLQDKLFESKKNSYSRIYYKSESYLAGIFNSKYSKIYLALAYYNEQPAAGGVFISYNKLLYYYLGASDLLLTKESKASNLIQYEIIKFAKTLGCINYDFGGIPFNTDPSIETYGVYLFKKNFGGDRNEYDNGNFVIKKIRYWIIWKLQRNQHHPLVSHVYNLLKGRSSA